MIDTSEALTKAEKLARALNNVMSGGRSFDRQLAAQCRDELRRLDQEASAAPEGWKLVPIEPTDAMMNAGLYQSSHDSAWGDVYSTYVDMVAATPDPQST